MAQEIIPSEVDELLGSSGGEWRRCVDIVRVPGDPPFRVVCVARSTDRCIVICEAAVGTSVPGRSVRLEWRRWIGLHRAIIVFTDAAHFIRIWSWFGADGRGLVEFHLPTRIDALVEAFAGLSAPSVIGAESPSDDLEKLVIGEVMRPMTVATPTRSVGEFGAFVDAVESVADLRACWRSLSSLTVLDPDCGTGTWLLQVGSVLRPLYHSILQRMRAMVDDAVAERARRGRDYLRDIVQLVELTHDRGRYGSQDDFVRRWISGRSLHGITDDPANARSVRRRLLSFAIPEGRGLTYLDANIFIARSGRGLPERAKRSREVSAISGADSITRVGTGSRPALPSRDYEIDVDPMDARIIRQSRALLQKYRMEHPLEDRYIRRAAAEWERRRRSISRGRASEARACAAGPTEPVTAGSFMPWIAKQVGFRIVRVIS